MSYRQLSSSSRIRMELPLHPDYAAARQFHPDPAAARKLSTNLCDIYHCCVYGEKLLMKDKGIVRNMESFISKYNLRKSMHLVGFIIRTVGNICIKNGKE
jgi:hypothetical protein